MSFVRDASLAISSAEEVKVNAPSCVVTECVPLADMSPARVVNFIELMARAPVLLLKMISLPDRETGVFPSSTSEMFVLGTLV